MGPGEACRQEGYRGNLGHEKGRAFFLRQTGAPSSSWPQCSVKDTELALGIGQSLILKIFLMWTIFKVFIAFVKTILLFYVFGFVTPCIWDLSSQTRDRTHHLNWKVKS